MHIQQMIFITKILSVFVMHWTAQTKCKQWTFFLFIAYAIRIDYERTPLLPTFSVQSQNQCGYFLIDNNNSTKIDLKQMERCEN